MEFEKIKELIGLVNDSDLSYFEVRSDNNYVKMDKSLYRNTESANQANNLAVNEACSTLNNIEKTEQTEKVENALQNIDEKIEEDFEYINSPMVGTFYSAISPEEPPFVIEGQKVSKGQVLCIVEAMKLMNEIVAEFDCEIVSVMAENSKMVEYSQPLFKIRR